MRNEGHLSYQMLSNLLSDNLLLFCGWIQLRRWGEGNNTASINVKNLRRPT